MVARKPTDQVDSAPFVVGMITVLKQFNPEYQEQFFSCCGQYVRSLVEATANKYVNDNNGAQQQQQIIVIIIIIIIATTIAAAANQRQQQLRRQQQQKRITTTKVSLATTSLTMATTTNVYSAHYVQRLLGNNYFVLMFST